MTLCVPAAWAVAAVLLLALVALPPALTALTARYERRQAAPPRVTDGRAPWHAHCFEILAGSEGNVVGRCACGTLGAVFVGGKS